MKKTQKEITDQLLSEGRARPITGYEDLYIITMGNEVYSKKSKKFLKKTQKDGEFYVSLRKNGKTTKKNITQLIKENFTKPKSVKLQKQQNRRFPKRDKKSNAEKVKFSVSCAKVKSFKYQDGKKTAVEATEYNVLCKECLHHMVVLDVTSLVCPECGNC